ncbi:IS5 family transposase [Methanobacterium spitsbergense]|uniref:IS5 family transposase n=1 Tax=Methanobacterium spitsbergense TaxID=2874285 RepID=UPI0021076BA7|nr:IS5 family transposase [Methanobacterium spitsbergense]
MYDNRTELGGRPNNDEIVMMKMLVLQSWYGLLDPELERQANDRISFHKFLGFPERIPDRSTVWAFKERLIYTGKDEKIWEELQRQIDAKGLKIKEGVIQDATFITTDPGHKKVVEPRGPSAKTRRNKDGEWTKKNGKSHFGYKLHSKMDIDHQLIKEIETTPASVHDSQFDLTKPGEVTYRDRGYFGTKCKCYNATMNRATRGHPLNKKDKTPKQTHNPQKITRRTTIHRNQKHIPLRPRQSHHNTTNTHQKHLHMLLLQLTTTKHPQTKKHNLANATQEKEKINRKKEK